MCERIKGDMRVKKMIGIIVAAHGEMSKGLIETSRMIVGHAENMATVDLLEGEGPESLRDKLKKAVESLDSGEGVMVLLDLYGGTPSNVSALLARELNIEVVSGVNLPMLLEIIVKRASKNLKELRQVAMYAGKEGIRSINEIVEKIESEIKEGQ